MFHRWGGRKFHIKARKVWDLSNLYRITPIEARITHIDQTLVDFARDEAPGETFSATGFKVFSSAISITFPRSSLWQITNTLVPPVTIYADQNLL